MQFWKMNGAGNDFIILNNLEERLPPPFLCWPVPSVPPTAPWAPTA